MADPVVRLEQTSVSVQPGGQAQVPLTVTSTSDIVEGYRLTVLGAQPARWAEVVPPTVNVYPGEEASAVVVFSPPSGTASASGRFPFGVKVVSTESADASSVVEGTVEVGQVAGLQAKIVPVTSTGRWRGRHVVQLSNWGNSPARLRLVASDPDATLGFYVRPDVVELPIGGRTTVRLTARARRPFLRGTEVRRPFQLVGEPLEAQAGPAPASPYGDPSRPVVDGALLQRPILTKGLVTLVGLALVLAVAGGVYAWRLPRGAPGSLSKLGTPPTPTGLHVVSSDATSIRLAWDPVDQIDTYGLQTVDDGRVTGEISVPGAQTDKTVSELAPATRTCFALRAIRPGLPGPASKQVCGQTAPAPASPSPSPTSSPSGTPGTSGTAAPPPPPPAVTTPPGSASPQQPGTTATPGGPLGGGKWVVVADYGRQSDSGALAHIDAVTTQLQAAGLSSAQTVSSAAYPGLKGPGLPPVDAWMAVVGPYDTVDAATADCPKVQAVTHLTCRSAQPEPS